MSLADQIFIDMCKDILANGTSTEEEKVRPHWEDGTSAYTIKRFGVVNRYDLCFGSGRRSRTIFMSSTAISGMNGPMRTVQSVRRTVIRWG